MITVFNRYEVYCGWSNEEFARLRSALAQGGIKYTWNNAMNARKENFNA